MSDDKFTVNHGDAVLVLRAEDEAKHLMINDLTSDVSLMVLGVSWALENEAWREKLIKRTRAKVQQKLDAESKRKG